MLDQKEGTLFKFSDFVAEGTLGGGSFALLLPISPNQTECTYGDARAQLLRKTECGGGVRESMLWKLRYFIQALPIFIQ